MVLFFRIITRLFVLGFAYVFACVAAMATLVVSVVGWRLSFGEISGASPDEELITLLFSGAFGIAAFFSISFSAITPAAIVGLVSEALSWRSVFVYLVSGAAIGLFLLTSSGVYEADVPPQQDLVITLAAGFVAGFVYWLIAGRSAGNWRAKPKTAVIVTE